MRNIPTEGLDYLSNSSAIQTCFAVRIEATNSTDSTPVYFYLTDAPMQISFDGNQYLPNRIINVGNLTLASGLQTHKLNVDVAGEWQDELDRGLVGPASSQSYLNKEIIVYKLYFNLDGSLVNMGNDTGGLYYFRGLITNINIKESIKSGSSTVTWSCANHFEDFNTVNGRLTDDQVHRGLVPDSGNLIPSQAAKRVAHQTDKGFIRSNVAIDTLGSYTTKETKYRTKSSWGGFKTKTEEYQEDVVREVDLKFNLAAKFLPTIYGVRQVSGIPIFIDTDKNDPSKVTVVYAVCEGEIDGFLNMYIEGIPVICSSSGDAVDTVCIGSQTSGHTLGKVNSSGVGDSDPAAHGSTLYIDTNDTTGVFTFYNGKSDQTADPGMVAKAAANGYTLQDGDVDYWTNDHKLLDTAYVVMEYTLNEDATSIPEIEFVVQGKKVEVYTSASASTTKQSLNPVWQLLEYMTSDMYGGNLSYNDFNIESFIAVGNQLDIIDTGYEETWTNYSRYLGWYNTSVDNRQTMQCNTLLPGSSPVIENIKGILLQFNGTINLIDGEYHLSMRRVTPAVADIDVSDIRGAINTKEQSNKSTWNTIQANIQDPAMGWSSNKVTFFNNVYKLQDRSIEKKGTVSYKHITNYYTARTRAEQALNQSRYSRTFTFDVWHKFTALTPNDVITLTYGRYNFNNKLLMVDKVVAKKDGLLTLTVQDYDPSIYATSADADNSDNEVSIVRGVPKPVDLQVDDYVGTDIGVSLVLNWQPVLVGGISHYIVKWGTERQTVLATQQQVFPSRGTDPRAYIDVYNLIPGTEYTFEIKTVLSSGKASGWSELVHTAGLSNANLPNVSDFRFLNIAEGTIDEFVGGSAFLSWEGIVDPNVTGYVVEVLLGSEDGQSDASRTILGTWEINKTIDSPERITWEYTIQNNIADYATTNSGAVGAFRDMSFRIKARNNNGGLSTIWSYID